MPVARRKSSELSWTRIKINSKVAATVGLGAGGSGDVEIDIHEAITGYDRAALDQQFAAGDGIVTRSAAPSRNGRLQLPPGKKVFRYPRVAASRRRRSPRIRNCHGTANRSA